MAFKDLRDFSDGQFLDLPINGRIYRVNDVDAETGVWVQKLANLGVTAVKAAETGGTVDGAELDDIEEHDMVVRILAGTYDQLVTDGVPWRDIQHVGMTAFIWLAYGEAAAQEHWEKASTSSGEEEPQPTPPNRASRRASAAAATTTRKRASTTGTRASKTAAPVRRSAK